MPLQGRVHAAMQARVSMTNGMNSVPCGCVFCHCTGTAIGCISPWMTTSTTPTSCFSQDSTKLAKQLQSIPNIAAQVLSQSRSRHCNSKDSLQTIVVGSPSHITLPQTCHTVTLPQFIFNTASTASLQGVCAYSSIICQVHSSQAVRSLASSAFTSKYQSIIASSPSPSMPMIIPPIIPHVIPHVVHHAHDITYSSTYIYIYSKG